jgi:hypothetical protein
MLGSEYEAVFKNKTLLNWTICNAPQVIQFIEATFLDKDIIWSSKPIIKIVFETSSSEHLVVVFSHVSLFLSIIHKLLFLY